MDDNQLVQDLVEGVVGAVNASRLPLAVKALALENVLLRVTASLREKAPDPAEPHPPQADPAE